MKTSKNILVTGGAGFIGANLVRELANDPHHIIHLLVEKNSNLWRLSDIINTLIIHEIDLADFDAVRTLVHTVKPSTIFHLAAYGGMCTQLNQKLIYDVNFYGTINLVNACKEVGFECFINTGSSSEYGMQEVPMHEELVLEPISDYGVAKAAATQFCLKEALFNKLPIYTIRPFSVYGDYEMPSRLIPTIMVNALEGKSIQLSSPHFVRDYIYIKDMVGLYMAVANGRERDIVKEPETPISMPYPPMPCVKYVFNGGTGVQSSIQDVITTVQELVGKPLDITWGASTPRPWEPKAWRGDITRAHNVLGWQPAYNLHDGLQASLAWFNNNLRMYTNERSHDVAQTPRQQSHNASVA